MQHGNFCATSEIWTDFMRGIVGGEGACVIISTNFCVSLWWCVELLVGTTVRMVRANCGQQARFAHFVSAEWRLVQQKGWRLMHKATSIKFIQYSNASSKKIILIPSLGIFYALQCNLEHLHMCEPCVQMFSFSPFIPLEPSPPWPPFNMALCSYHTLPPSPRTTSLPPPAATWRE